MTRKIEAAIIGDNFMRASVFEANLRNIQGVEWNIRSLELPWPDEPSFHGEEGTELEGLKELQGDPAELANFIKGAEVLVCHLPPITRSMLKVIAPPLQLIGVSRGGPVNIDMKAAKDAGVIVVNAPGRNASAVAEFTIGAILAETRLITKGHVSLSQGIWRGDLYRADLTGPELSELTVGLIGYGHIGTRVTKLLKPFGCKILVDDPYVKVSEEDLADGVEQVDLAELLRRSDVVSLHARVTPETTGFMNKSTFAQMKKGAWFINTARGPMVNYPDLYEALQSGHLRGAMLETHEVEPCPPDLPLLKHPNVTLTPHIAGASTTTVKIAARMIGAEIDRWIKGEPLKNVATK
ncbi:MAG TPA: 2-hydroxyacid dehydrogenase [Geminicoccus sp.]|jgi:D-3-phosphoglycerate dehydrogenase|uniref:2-hydroxyacid dehydrogenase n=1 Tax=Geminicoccus sp. TaxID=2024832 RepID=UPI002E309A4A|nr:2-hydroxyacid dehydrogenase [Geminicoccus sp.]HEX2528946.1 2-hydroxyacid dehydrogenase [Geminicoccus sp.]